MKEEELDGKVAIITGASGGIAKEIILILDKLGVKLCLADINPENLEKIKSSLIHEPLTVKTNICNLTEVKSLMKLTIEKYGHIHLLINTVGIIFPNLFENTSYENIRKQIDTNLLGTIQCIKEVIPYMKKNEKSYIITISSLAGIVPETYSSIYTATKFALRGLGFTLNLELEKHNICLSTIFPDSVNTPMLEYEAREGGSPLTFLHDPVDPGDVAKAVLKAIKKDKVEVCIPHLEGILSKIIMCLPKQVKRLWPKYEIKGEKKKIEFLESLNQNN